VPNIDLKDHPQIFQDRPQTIYVQVRVGDGDKVVAAYSTFEEAELQTDNAPWGTETVTTTLHRPSLQPIYGGPTLLEALWAEMDRLMAGLMTGQGAEDVCNTPGCNSDRSPCGHTDNGDKYRAQELAWVIAIVTNAYAPSVDAVRAEALRRWNGEIDG
jgi:hypothetical protein